MFVGCVFGTYEEREKKIEMQRIKLYVGIKIPEDARENGTINTAGRINLAIQKKYFFHFDK